MKEYTIKELANGLKTGAFTAVDLVRMYVEQIKKLDQAGPKLNAIAALNPDALEIAKALDQEYQEKGPRSILHGIPFVVKDNIHTGDQMPTTASSFALKDMIAKEDAFIVKKLRDAGMVLLGKANLSEFAYFMSYDDMPSGYGSLNGQVKSPYHEKIDPLGSSTGSAVAVAANLIPVSVGTETNGSLTAPAQNNSICTIKPTLGLVSRTGIIPITHLQDTAGPMGRTVEDVALFLEAMVGKDPFDEMTHHLPKKRVPYASKLKKDMNDLTIGFLKFSNVTYHKEETAIFDEAKKLLSPLAKKTTFIEIEARDMPNHKTLEVEFKHDINRYFKSMEGISPMTSLKDLIAFNQKHKKRCLKYGQSIFEASEATSGNLKDPHYLKMRNDILKQANHFTNLMNDHDIDVLVLSRRTSHAPIAGNPVVSVPAKALTDTTPRSLFFVAKCFDDASALRVAYHYEQRTNYRISPPINT